MATIHHRERTQGVHPTLLAFLDWWEAHGPFDLTVTPNGGLRTDPEVQARFEKVGSSGAASLAETPHGRGGAIDVAPLIAGQVPWHEPDYFRVVGQAAEKFGLVWGGRWRSFDADHLELKDWRALPFPPHPEGVA